MRGGRVALAAIVAAVVWAGIAGQTLAQAPAGESSPQKPAERSAPKPPDGRVSKPAEGSAKPADGSAKPAEGSAKPADGSAQKQGDDAAPKLRLLSILGREVTNREGDGGRVIDVLVDLDGRSGAVVVEFGGFMGIGSRKVAVHWSALRFVREGNRTSLVVDVSRDQIRDAAEYKPNEPPNVLTTK